MSTKRFTDEFKIEAVNQLLGHGHRVADAVAQLRLPVMESPAPPPP